MLGYSDVKEWVENEFPVGDVAGADREKVINAYMEASQNFKGSFLQARITRKDGQNIQTEIIMIPIPYKDEVFVLHFVSKK